MKKFLFSLVLIICVSLTVSAKEKAGLTEEEMNYAIEVSKIDNVSAPYLKGNKVIFTAQKDAHYVGIAFDFENFRTIHSFYKKNIRNMDNETIDSFYFYILDIPKDVQKINYRLVIDGLWTCDPLNENKVYNKEANLLLSQIDCTRPIPEVTEEKSPGYVRFVYKGKSGQQVRLGGSFTNWDSWIYIMKEVEPGVYEFNLPLNSGTYQYAFYSGMQSFIDRENPERCYTLDGKQASVLVVK